MPPIITIITPTYNVSEYLQKSISSIAKQGYSNLEYLIIDAKSTDNTLQIIKENEHIITKWISEPDKGIYDAFNKGIKISKGEWLLFLGADDYLEEGILQKIEPILQKENPDILYGKVYERSRKINVGKEMSLSELSKPGKTVPHQAIFYKRTVFEKIAFYDLRFPVLADQHLNLKCFADNKLKKVFVDLVVSSYSGEGFSNGAIDTNFYKNINQELNLIKEKIEDSQLKNKISTSQSFYHILSTIIYKNQFIGLLRLFSKCLLTGDFSYLKHGLYHSRIRIFKKRKFI